MKRNLYFVLILVILGVFILVSCGYSSNRNTEDYLYKINSIICNYKKIDISRLILSLCVILLCITLEYIAWGISSGYLFQTEPEFLFQTTSEIVISFLIVIVGYGIGYQNSGTSTS